MQNKPEMHFRLNAFCFWTGDKPKWILVWLIPGSPGNANPP